METNRKIRRPCYDCSSTNIALYCRDHQVGLITSQAEHSNKRRFDNDGTEFCGDGTDGPPWHVASGSHPQGIGRRSTWRLSEVSQGSSLSCSTRPPDISSCVLPMSTGWPRDPRVGPSGTSFPEALGISSGAIFDLFTYSMITADGDVHRRRRAPFSRLFAARTINDMRLSIRRTADDLIGEWYERGEVDYFGEFAAPMPARIISDLLGLPRAGHSGI